MEGEKTRGNKVIRIRMLRRLIFIFVIAGLIMGYFLFTVLKPQSSSGSVVDIEITKGQNLDQIVKILIDSGLLKHPRYFKTLALLMAKDSKLKAGSYTIPKNTSVYRLVRIISESNGEFKLTVTIPEGFTLKQAEERLSAVTGRPVDLSRFRIVDFSKQFPVLAGVPSGLNLEGYFFPDTYNIDKYDSDAELVSRLLTNFDKKLTEELRSEIKKQNKTIHEIMTMASLIEREVPQDREQERQIVSGILWKRLKAGMALQIDATIVYATGKNGQKVLLDDLQIDSPYNTYLHPGLPPGPIANPGLGAILATIYPQDSSYWYYLSKPNGETVFSKTLEEHNAAKAKYLQ